MDLTPLVEAAQNSALSEWMRTSLKAVAIINAPVSYTHLTLPTILRV